MVAASMVLKRCNQLTYKPPPFKELKSCSVLEQGILARPVYFVNSVDLYLSSGYNGLV